MVSAFFSSYRRHFLTSCCHFAAENYCIAAVVAALPAAFSFVAELAAYVAAVSLAVGDSRVHYRYVASVANSAAEKFAVAFVGWRFAGG